MMQAIRLRRFAYTPMGTFGTIPVPGSEPLWTVELPWRGNLPFESCIPVGEYQIVRGTFRDQYANFELLDVPGRDHIEIHRGNVAGDLRGCIAPGLSLGVVNGTWGVLASRAAMDRLMRELSGVDRSYITITEELKQW